MSIKKTALTLVFCVGFGFLWSYMDKAAEGWQRLAVAVLFMCIAIIGAISIVIICEKNNK